MSNEKNIPVYLKLEVKPELTFILKINNINEQNKVYRQTNNQATSQNNPEQVENKLNYQKNIPVKLKLNAKPELTVTLKTNKINKQLENNSLNNQPFFNQSYNKKNAKISKVKENSQLVNKPVNEINNQHSSVQSSKNSYSRPLSELKSDILNGLNFFLYYNDELDLKSLINRQILNTSDPFK